MTNIDDAKNGQHHIPLHGFGDHEKRPSMAHNSLIAITLVIEDHSHFFLTRQDRFYLTNKHQPLSKSHSPRLIRLADRYQAVLGSPPG